MENFAIVDYKSYAQEKYDYTYLLEYEKRVAGKISDNAKKAAERDAQHIAILKAFTDTYDKYDGKSNATSIWNAIYSAHIKRKAGTADLNELNEEIIDKIISGAQSWKKSSGHVFEDYVSKYTQERLKQKHIRLLLQKDVTTMLRENQIANDPDDAIPEMVASEDFDLYAVLDLNGDNLVFGCVQVKTSIRDRVGRDRDFSIPIMNRHFWSAAVVLDGTYLHMPKFNAMVNGSGEENYKYRDNGWHGMYTLSNMENSDRIYYDPHLDLLIKHAEEAAKKFTSARQRFGQEWKAMQGL